MDRQVRFANLLVNEPRQILRTVCTWIRQLAEEKRQSDEEEESARAAAEVIRMCPGGNPRLLITRITLPPTINMAAPPGTPYKRYISDYVIPFIAAQRRLQLYQQTKCNMSAAPCNIFTELADQIELMLEEFPDAVVGQQYVVLHLVLCDVLPAELFHKDLWPFLSLYHRLGGEEAHSPEVVTNGIVAILEAWLRETA
jgi:hypothetical protein